MKTVYSEKHAKHAPAVEAERGRFIPFKETPARLVKILEKIEARKLGPVFPPQDHGIQPILDTHDEKYLRYLETAYREWVSCGGNEDGVFPDTWAVRQFANALKKDDERHPVNQSGILGKAGYYACDCTAVIVDGTWQAAYDAAQTVLTAADLLTAEWEKAVTYQYGVFALCRPPGHHAHQDLAAGYCFLNNAAIATRYLLRQDNISKVAILDIDYHHGNGTQHIFYSEKTPLYVSLHAFPEYPYFWGSADETGDGEGKGFNVNVPLDHGTTPEVYLKILKETIKNHIVPYGADVLIVSLGVDTYVHDPVGGSIFLETESYKAIGAAIADVKKPTLFVMEGGYALDAIGDNVCNVLQGFEGTI